MRRLAADGRQLWSKVYGREGRQTEFASSVEVTAEGEFLFVGTVGFFADVGTGQDVFVLTVDDNGETQRETRLGFEFEENLFGGAILSPAQGHAVWPTADGGFVACGTERGFYLAKVLPTQRSDVAFRRGDVSADGRLNIADAIQLLFETFGLRSDLLCVRSGDVNDNGALELADAVYLLNFLFRRGDAPPSPFPICGVDATEDQLTCAAFPVCN